VAGVGDTCTRRVRGAGRRGGCVHARQSSGWWDGPSRTSPTPAARPTRRFAVLRRPPAITRRRRRSSGWPPSAAPYGAGSARTYRPGAVRGWVTVVLRARFDGPWRWSCPATPATARVVDEASRSEHDDLSVALKVWDVIARLASSRAGV